ncbi:uncharacterized protein LOC110452809 [Mizuhopecten yessoensis]|uniref:Uncharacterized protein n=1 Tax=Mizuhopecten yessoensis TaxID=6573 RepID=A0A210QIR5_MIZYE|nr:uncharacterized protein LOC110452809 [Mizuhopecten yessoensis]OWF48630.1 hypothetical protein KP79_PYT16170 [Mizuhopecten yessoensis]
MSLKDSDQSIFTGDSKIKKYLRQSLEDKCSAIGGRQVYFGLNESMIRMLTPIEEVMTPVPGLSSRSVTPESLFSGNTTSWTLSNPEDFPDSLSERDLTDVNVNKVRCLREPDIGLHKDNDLNTTTNKGSSARTKFDSTTKSKPKQRIKKPGLSAGQRSAIAETVTSARDNVTSRLSGGQGDRLNEMPYKKIKTDKRNQKPLTSVQRLSGNGHTITSIELPAVEVPVVKRVSNNRKQNPSSGTGHRSGPQVSYTNVSVKCTLPPLEKESFRIPKRSSKAKPKERNGIHILPSAQHVSKSDKITTGTRVGTLPPIAFISGRSTSVHKEATREVKLTRTLQFHDTQEVGVTKRRRERVETVRDNINLPSINPTKRPL